MCCSVWQCWCLVTGGVFQCVGVWCSVLQCVAVCCSVWQCCWLLAVVVLRVLGMHLRMVPASAQHSRCSDCCCTANHRNRLPYCNILHHTATHCTTLQHTATHSNTLQHATTSINRCRGWRRPDTTRQSARGSVHTQQPRNAHMRCLN